jgi:hypothetical protein
MQIKTLIIITTMFWVATVFVGCTATGAPDESEDVAEDTITVVTGVEQSVTIEATQTAGMPLTTPTGEPEPSLQPEMVAAKMDVTPDVTINPNANHAANADVLYVVARQESENVWHFSVTVEHPDTGWEDYADGWDVVLPDGTVVKPDPESPFTRLLLHPHENEQPFTRSQSGILIPPHINSVTVRAHDLVDGFGGSEVLLDLEATGGADFEIKRIGDEE